MTVLEVIKRSTEFLAKKGIDSARLQTELLLAHVLKLPRMKLYLNFERKLADAELNQLRELVVRRSQREPLQHITGSASFCGLEIAVNKQVLIPRPETELLAELGWQFLNQLLERGVSRTPYHNGEKAAKTPGNPTLRAEKPTALDFGTGSGCIAIALAINCPAAQITALDISPDALAIAKQNAANHKVGEQIRFHQGDGFAALNSPFGGPITRVPNQSEDSAILPPRSACFDLIASNPPYIASAEISTLQAEVRDFDPRAALDGGTDGLDYYRRLAREAADFLKPGGKMMLEFGIGQVDSLRQIFEGQKWVVEAVTEDYSHRARILTTRPKAK